jgi:hypothetical protein
VAAAAGKNLQADAYYESVKDKEDLFN